MGRNQPSRYALINRLEMAGMDKQLSNQITEQVLPCDDVEMGWRKSLGLLGTRIKIADKDLLKEGGVIDCEAPRHPLPTMHPDTRAGLIETARRLDPLVLRWSN